MLRIEYENRVLYLAPLCDGWYCEFGVDWMYEEPNYYLVKNKKIIEESSEMPDIVWDKIKNA